MCDDPSKIYLKAEPYTATFWELISLRHNIPSHHYNTPHNDLHNQLSNEDFTSVGCL